MAGKTTSGKATLPCIVSHHSPNKKTASSEVFSAKTRDLRYDAGTRMWRVMSRGRRLDDFDEVVGDVNDDEMMGTRNGERLR